MEAVEEAVLLQPLQAFLCGDPWICQQAKPLPRLGIRNAPRCFPRGGDECALAQLLPRWSSVWAVTVVCETQSVHLIPDSISPEDPRGTHIQENSGSACVSEKCNFPTALT